MEQFSLEKYLANPSRKVVTRDGRNARIICTDRRDLNFPIVTLIEKDSVGEVIYAHTKDVIYCNTCPTTYDLFFAPEKHEGWTFFTKSFGIRYIESIICATREEAQRMREADPSRYGAIVKLEWEE